MLFSTFYKKKNWVALRQRMLLFKQMSLLLCMRCLIYKKKDLKKRLLSLVSWKNTSLWFIYTYSICIKIKVFNWLKFLFNLFDIIVSKKKKKLVINAEMCYVYPSIWFSNRKTKKKSSLIVCLWCRKTGKPLVNHLVYISNMYCSMYVACKGIYGPNFLCIKKRWTEITEHFSLYI